jgi:DNA-binding transcriptional LysR family regulator
LALLPLFESFLSAHDRLHMDVRHLARAERGAVSLGVVPFLAEEWLAELLLRFSKEHPDVRVLATDHGSQQVRQLVANGTIDIGVAEVVADDPKLSFRPIATDAFGILCSTDHPLAARKRAPWSVLKDACLIGSNLFHLLKRAGLDEWLDEPAMVVTNRTALVASVKANAGITIVPQLIGPVDMKGVVFVPLERPRVTRTIGLITRRDESLLPAAAAMFNAVQVSLSQHCRRKGAEVHDGKSRISATVQRIRSPRSSVP